MKEYVFVMMSFTESLARFCNNLGFLKVINLPSGFLETEVTT